MDALECIRSRRTHKQFTGAPLSRAQLETLIECGISAPNHKLTEPWRFFAVPHERVADLVAAITRAIDASGSPKLTSKRDSLVGRLRLLGGYLAIAREPSPDPVTDREDYAACCCAAHNVLLGATAMGLGAFWTTGEAFQLRGVLDFLGIPPGMDLVASIWLGVPAAAPTSRRRPAAELTRWV